jgi:nucleotide-binding universal stress UspA family protein
MQKILLAIDGLQIDMPALEFACYLGRLTKSEITGVFLENMVADERPVLEKAYDIPHLDWKIDRNSEDYKKKSETIKKNILFFKEACDNREINSRIHRDRGVPAKEIIEESRFADLIIIDAETSFNKRYEGTPTEFVKDVLKHTECPVIIAPKSFDGIDEIIFSYDGTESSMFAIKQFGYLFPELRQTKALLLEISGDNAPVIDQKHKVQEWLKAHYSDYDCKLLQGDVKDQLFSYLLPKKNVFVVMGSYGRNAISSIFKKSNADMVLKTANLPLFITHA